MRTASKKTVSIPDRFLAIDFETANYAPDSACAVGLVRVESNQIVAESGFLIRPPSRSFAFTHIHGLEWHHVANAATFGERWSEISPLFEGITHLVAHNAGFDRKVLHSCCHTYGIVPPVQPFVCSMVTARKVWGIRPTRLSNVCAHLSIALNHHEALSDARACAKILIHAREHQIANQPPQGPV